MDGLMTDFNVTECLDSAKSDSDCDLKCIIFGPTLAAFTAVAVSGNVAGIVVLRKSLQWPRMNTCLIVLAMWEIVLLVASFFLYSARMFIRPDSPVQNDYVKTFAYWYTLMTTANQADIWTVLVLAVDRYFAICSPFRHRRFERRLKGKVLAAISIFAVLHGLPRFFEVSVVTCTSLNNGTVIASVVPSGLQQDYTYRVVYKIIGGVLLYSVGPFLTLSFIAVQVSRHLNRYAITRRKLVEIYQSSSATNFSVTSTSDKKKDQNKDQLLLIIILKFLICHSLPTTLDIMETVGPESLFKTETVNHLVDVSNILVIINSGCNVLVYVMLSQNFRSQFAKFIFRLRRKEHSNAMGSSYRNYRQEAPQLLLNKNNQTDV